MVTLNMDPEESTRMARKLRPIPVFADEADERRFWETHDSADYGDWSRTQRVHLPNLTAPRVDETPRAAVSAPEAVQDRQTQ
jgi:hypothetical protein